MFPPIANPGDPGEDQAAREMGLQLVALRRSEATGLLTINFTWLNGLCGGDVSGWEESIVIPYAPLLTFMRESTLDGGPKTWKHLSVCSTSRPRLVFHDQKRLRECVTNKTVRGKLARVLRDNFLYSGAEQIGFYHDFEPYSFLFRETRGAVSALWAV